MLQYIADIDHYNTVLGNVRNAEATLWIGTADIKDLHVKNGSYTVPFLEIIAGLINRWVEVRLIHAKEPGTAFREDFDKYPLLKSMLEQVLCPRVHFNLIIIDNKLAYIGSVNLTGAGMGMKSGNRGNFEVGIFTDEPEIVEAAMEQFDSVCRGEHCKKCGKREYCGDPVI